MSQSHNLPNQVTSFVGRGHEVAELKRLVGTTRLLTLTGAGGVGKTRLALQAAFELLDEFADGVWLIELASLADPALVTQTAATALHIQEDPGQPILDTLINHLRQKQLLLILDNCEHLIESCAHLAEALLRACAYLQILATSREALGIAGETDLNIPPLSFLAVTQGTPTMIDMSQSESVHLFVDRAVAVQPNFRLTKRNAAAVAQVCRQLDGIPLAIELAAARVKVLEVTEITARLDDRFSFLTHGFRTAPPRHQTLRAAIDWSYDLLSEPERELVRRLSVFAGDWTLAAAEGVCARVDGDEPSATSTTSAPRTERRASIHPSQVFELLALLVDKSLVIADKHDSETRYHMLETIRQYARGKLLESGELEQLSSQHLEFFCQFAEVAESHLEQADQIEWLTRLDREQDNLRTAMRYALASPGQDTGSQRLELGLRIVGALSLYWWKHSRITEGRQWLAEFLAGRSAGSASAQAKALLGAGRLAFHQDASQEAILCLEQSLALYRSLDNKRGVATALVYLSGEAEDDDTRAVELSDESIRLARQLGDKALLADAIYQRGELASQQGDLNGAARYLNESFVLFRELGERSGLGVTLKYLAVVTAYQGDYERAAALARDAEQINRALGDVRGIGSSLWVRGVVELRHGDNAAARALFAEALPLVYQTKTWNYAVGCLEMLSYLAAADAQYELAARLLGAAEAQRQERNRPIHLLFRVYNQETVAVLSAQLDEIFLAQEWVKGRAMTLDQAVEYALESTAPKQAAQPHAPRQPANQRFGELTKREREVAGLVARGASNREIAQELVVSERTVESHVTAIFTKLGFSKRAQIAAWAVETGLVNLPR